MINILLLFAWYDMWVGAFWDKKAHWLYILPIPMCGIILKFRPPIITILHYNDFWYICDPAGVQIGEPVGSSHTAYMRAWDYYKRLNTLHDKS